MDAICSLPDPLGMKALRHITALDQDFSDFYVDVTCSCGHGKMWRSSELAALAGATATFEQLKKRLVCKECGKRDMDIIARAVPRPRGYSTH